MRHAPVGKKQVGREMLNFEVRTDTKTLVAQRPRGGGKERNFTRDSKSKKPEGTSTARGKKIRVHTKLTEGAVVFYKNGGRNRGVAGKKRFF